jgi:hypothetical protein
MADTHDTWAKHIYETPRAEVDLLSQLRGALAGVPDLHEAYLVERRSVYAEQTRRDGLGVVAHVGGRWRARRQLAEIRERLRPFYPPRESAPLRWGAFGNSPVLDEARAVGTRLMGRS